MPAALREFRVCAHDLWSPRALGGHGTGDRQTGTFWIARIALPLDVPRAVSTFKIWRRAWLERTANIQLGLTPQRGLCLRLHSQGDVEIFTAYRRARLALPPSISSRDLQGKDEAVITAAALTADRTILARTYQCSISPSR
jgi:hypothetical protein